VNVYHPMRIDSGEWRTDYFDSYCFGLCDMRRYFTAGDSTVDGFHFKKLIEDVQFYQDGHYYGLYKGLIREDTLNKKIYL